MISLVWTRPSACLLYTSGRIVYDGQTIFEGKDPWQRKSVPVREKDGSTTKREELVQVKVPRPKQVNMLPYRRKMQIIFQDPVSYTHLSSVFPAAFRIPGPVLPP